MNDTLRTLVRAADPFLTKRIREERVRVRALTSPVRWGSSVAVIGLAPGVGGTTLTAQLARVLAQHQGERVLAVDADPSNGLRARLGGSGPVGQPAEVLVGLGVRPAGPDDSVPGQIGYQWLRQRLARVGGLSLLAVDSTSGSPPLSATEYADALKRLQRWFRVVVTDTSPKRHTQALPAVVRAADHFVLATSDDPQGLRLATEARGWIASLARRPIDGRAVFVLVEGSGGANIALRAVREALGDGAVVRLPRDPSGVAMRTRQAVLAVAGHVALGLSAADGE